MQKPILKDPSSTEAYEALATVLVPLGKLEFAIRAKAKAISLGYNSASSWEMLGDMFVSLGQFADATEAFAPHSISSRMRPSCGANFIPPGREAPLRRAWFPQSQFDLLRGRTRICSGPSFSAPTPLPPA